MVTRFAPDAVNVPDNTGHRRDRHRGRVCCRFDNRASCAVGVVSLAPIAGCQPPQPVIQGCAASAMTPRASPRLPVSCAPGADAGVHAAASTFRPRRCSAVHRQAACPGDRASAIPRRDRSGIPAIMSSHILSSDRERKTSPRRCQPQSCAAYCAGGLASMV